MREGNENMKTIKQYAEEQGVSYEAIRKQIGTYREDLKEHIIVKGRTQYLDAWAVDFLTQKRKENPVILLSQEKVEEVEDMRQQIETLRTQLLLAQNALIKSQEERIKDKEIIIGLQEESRKTLEERSNYANLLEESKQNAEKLKAAEDRESALIAQIEDKTNENRMISAAAHTLRTRIDESQKMIEYLKKKVEESDSYEKAFLGLYRKKK